MRSYATLRADSAHSRKRADRGPRPADACGVAYPTTMSKTSRTVKKQTVTNPAAQPTSTTDTVIVTSPNVERDGSKKVVYLRARDTDAPKPRCRFADRDVKRESPEPRTNTQLITAGSLDSELAGPLVNCDPLLRHPTGCGQHRSATTRSSYFEAWR